MSALLAKLSLTRRASPTGPSPLAVNPLDGIPIDVLAEIAALVCAGSSAPHKTVTPKRLFSKSAKPSAHMLAIETRMDRARAVLWSVRALRLSCKALGRATAHVRVLQAAIRTAGFELPERLFVGGTYNDVLRCHWALLKEEAAEQKLWDSGKGRCGFAVSSMSAPQRNHLGPHPPDPEPFEKFAGLTEDEQTRIVATAVELVDFLRAFGVFSSGPVRNTTPTLISKGGEQWAATALLRYRMFVTLQLRHPNALLIPTADILYAQVAHLLRTKEYREDLPTSAVRNAVLLGEIESRTYNDAVLATARLWAEAFPGTHYLPSEAFVPWSYFSNVKSMSRRMNMAGDAHPTFERAPAYYACMGPAPPAAVAAGLQGIVNLRITADDLSNDFKWMAEFETQFRAFAQQAYHLLGVYGGDNSVTMLRHAMPSYQRFLFLARHNPHVALSPPLYIDVLWHAHQLTPALYDAECKRVLGFVAEHCPWSGRTGAEAVPFAVPPETKMLWNDAFGTDICVDYRYLWPTSTQRDDSSASDSTDSSN